MPSEARSREALAALARPRALFHSAIVAAVDELRALLAEYRAPAAERSAQESARLGAFAGGHIDVARFATLIAGPARLDAARVDRLEQALTLLESFVGQGDSLYRVHVQHGVDLRNAVRGELAARGTVFRAAHEVALLRSGGSLGAPIGDAALMFRHWRRAEKDMAPPIVVEVAGSDLYAAGLAEFMDGVQKIVLIVEGPAAAAPLARLITPRTFVMQTADPSALARLGEYDGPGIAAVLPEGCAQFTHDPARGATLAQRLHVDFLPDPPQRGSAGGSARQQAEDVAWLAELAQLAALSAPAGDEPAETAQSAPADQLAAWLLRMSGEPVGS
jgi:hypothetical protein